MVGSRDASASKNTWFCLLVRSIKFMLQIKCHSLTLLTNWSHANTMDDLDDIAIYWVICGSEDRSIIDDKKH